MLWYMPIAWMSLIDCACVWLIASWKHCCFASLRSLCLVSLRVLHFASFSLALWSIACPFPHWLLLCFVLSLIIIESLNMFGICSMLLQRVQAACCMHAFMCFTAPPGRDSALCVLWPIEPLSWVLACNASLGRSNSPDSSICFVIFILCCVMDWSCIQAIFLPVFPV